MVGEDLNGEGGTMKVVLPSFEGMNDGKEFVVIYVIVMLCRREGLRKVETRMSFSVGICLKKNGP